MADDTLRNDFGAMLGRWMFLAWFAWLGAQAQDNQFLPEIDGHLTLNSNFRGYLQAKDDREGGDRTQFTFGPSVQYHRKPLLKLKSVTLFDLDDAKSRPLIVESGYRIISAPNTPPTNRAIEAVTFHYPVWGGILVTVRNRADLDWQSGSFTWRFRAKLTIERTFRIRSYHLIPYAAAEPFYESQYNKWSTTDLYAGCLLPVGKKVQFDSYYQHQNNTGRRPNREDNFVGLALHLYFSLENKSRSSSQPQTGSAEVDNSKH
jgi:hypothetical protein